MPYGLAGGDITAMQRIFDKYSGVDEAVLFGSRAKGTHKPHSDIDIALRGNSLTLETKGRIEDDLDDLLLPQKMDITLFRYIDNNDLIAHINRVGKILYAKDKRRSV